MDVSDMDDNVDDNGDDYDWAVTVLKNMQFGNHCHIGCSNIPGCIIQDDLIWCRM